MDILLGLLVNILEEGLIYGVMALGVYITYKILDFPDLSVDGTFTLGACGASTAPRRSRRRARHGPARGWMSSYQSP